MSAASNANEAAHAAADRLALALEDAGFDVGRDFPALAGAVDRDGVPGVDLGRISPQTALRLSVALSASAT